ncbi:plasmid replication/partition related protein [Rhodoferax fermentans]|uniref:Plasmid replication/partition related protein n=1 Tax=Rhodoferax fermentans TaxID=28066 RepID=A0A1T1AYH6_RHOFE|nr:plasmid replication/partition related protein [Rhodoferax fermentans]MBK1682936.1 plasmid replication/partition related protein [Rhodoferax fermentans]OOV09162.1 plasmid replication/partition related protein [Rhodoferax fermentans]
MNIIVNEELKAYIDPLTPEEYTSLERSILAEGCRDALVLWGEVLVDGHNRYAICQAHGLPFQTIQNTLFKSMEDVHLWMIDQHLGRRSVSDFQRGVLALRKREIIAERRARTQAPAPATADADDTSSPPWDDTGSAPELATVPPLASRDDIAKAARLSSNQVVLIEKIRNQATPEVVAALKSGAISLNAAAAVASLPAQEQVAAAVGGADELKQAAKRVREAKRPPRAVSADATDQSEGTAHDAIPGDDVPALKKRIAQLEKENDALRKQVLNLLEKSSRSA